MDFKKALSKSMHICSQREYCVFDIETKLQKWEVSIDDKHKIIDTLIDEKYIDHNRYVPAFINDKLNFNHWGRVKIRYYLKQKKVEDSVINEHLNLIDDTAYDNILVDEVNKKKLSLKIEDSFEKNQKVAKYLISKGFEPDKVFSKVITSAH